MVSNFRRFLNEFVQIGLSPVVAVVRFKRQSAGKCGPKESSLTSGLSRRNYAFCSTFLSNGGTVVRTVFLAEA